MEQWFIYSLSSWNRDDQNYILLPNIAGLELESLEIKQKNRMPTNLYSENISSNVRSTTLHYYFASRY